MVSAASKQAQKSAFRIYYMAEVHRESSDAASDKNSPNGLSAYLSTGNCRSTGMHISSDRKLMQFSTLLVASPAGQDAIDRELGKKLGKPAEPARPELQLQGTRKLLPSAHRFGPPQRLEALACNLTAKIMEDCCTI